MRILPVKRRRSEAKIAPFTWLAVVCGSCCVCGSQAQNLPDLFTRLLPPINFALSTNQVFLGDMLTVNWPGANNGTFCIPEDPFCFDIFGPAYGPWDDAVFLFDNSTNRLLGTATFAGWLPPHGGYRQQATFAVPLDLRPGVYGVEIRIDYLPGTNTGHVVEQNELNNTDRISRAVTVLPRLSFTGIRRQSDGHVILQIRGALDQAVRIQISSTLPTNAWADLVSFPRLRETIEYTDNTATNSPMRFYRALSP